eukprot:Amastigsp_a186190_9.p1 type:complete len:155 gc:universal Amastigsp_a186190_9:472-8(-)
MGLQQQAAPPQQQPLQPQPQPQPQPLMASVVDRIFSAASSGLRALSSAVGQDGTAVPSPSLDPHLDSFLVDQFPETPRGRRLREVFLIFRRVYVDTLTRDRSSDARSGTATATDTATDSVRESAGSASTAAAGAAGATAAPWRVSEWLFGTARK